MSQANTTTPPALRLLGETLSAGQLLGAAVVGLALIVIDGRLAKRLGIGTNLSNH